MAGDRNEMNLSLIATLARWVIAVCVVSLVGWHVTHIGTAPRGRATIYVPRPNDVVSIDNQDFPVESIERPVVRDLESGKHVLRLKRGVLTISEEDFLIEPEKEVILTPQDRTQLATRRTPPKADLTATSSRGPTFRPVGFRRSPN